VHHDTQIDHLKDTQAEQRYRERSAQVRAELEAVDAEALQGARSLAACQAAQARVVEQIAAKGNDLEAARAALFAAESALAEQRRTAQQAERDAQDAVFGERECAAKISEMDNSVRVIDQQIEHADVEVAKLTA
jgi:chromosome segregation protein